MSRTTLRKAAGGLCAIVVLSAFSGAAYAAATLVEDNRRIDVLLDLIDPDDNTLLNPLPIEPAFATSFNDSLFESGDSPSFFVEGDVFADQVSSLDTSPSAVFNVYRASGSVDTNAFEFDFDGSVQAVAESDASIVFSISEPHDYTFSGALLRSSGSSKLDVEATLGIEGGSDIFSTTSAGAFMSDGELAPGTYRVDLEASLFALSDNNGGQLNHNASFSSVLLTLTVVPEPATIALLVLGGLVAMRRRVRW